MPTCSDCHKVLNKSEFAKSQSKKPSNKRRCLDCVEENIIINNNNYSISSNNTSTILNNSTDDDDKIKSKTKTTKKTTKTKNVEEETTISKLKRLTLNDLKPDDVVRFRVKQVNLANNGGTVDINGELGKIKNIASPNGPIEVEVVTGLQIMVGSSLMDPFSINNICFPVQLDMIEKISNPHQEEDDQLKAKMGNKKYRIDMDELENRGKRGDANAYYELGILHMLSSVGRKENAEELSRSSFEKAASMGHVRAKNKLGHFYYDGFCGPKDIELAGMYHKMAADETMMNSAYKYAMMLLGGQLESVGVDTIEAERYLQICKDHGYLEAVPMLKRLRMHHGKSKLRTPQKATKDDKEFIDKVKFEREVNQKRVDEEIQKEREKIGHHPGPTGLDPLDVLESLPIELLMAFPKNGNNPEHWQIALDKMDPEVAEYHMKRCFDSGLMVRK